MADPPWIARGGKSLYGARVGILMLETRFPRIPGDMGNAETWTFPVLYKVVPGASPRRVVCDGARGLLDEFLNAAEELVRLGADGITTTCGFLSLYQRQIAAHVGVPVVTSSLMQIPFIERVLPPGKRVGVLTVSAANLTEEHLLAAGADPATPLGGTDNGSEFTRVMINDEERLDVAAAERDILAAGRPARMHQHGALCSRALRATAPAGVQHLHLRDLVPSRSGAARFRPSGERAPRMARTMRSKLIGDLTREPAHL